MNFAIAPFGKSVVLITLVAVIALILQAIMMFAIAFYVQRGTAMRLVFVFAGMTSGVLLLLMYAMAPTSYKIDNGNLMISRRIWDLCIPVGQIESVCQVDSSVLDGCVRIRGCGGFAGYYGLYSSPKLGRFRAYITRKDSLVLVSLKEGYSLILSPRKPELLVTTIDAMIIHKE